MAPLVGELDAPQAQTEGFGTFRPHGTLRAKETRRGQDPAAGTSRHRSGSCPFFTKADAKKFQQKSNGVRFWAKVLWYFLSRKYRNKNKSPHPLPFGRGWGFIRSIYYRAKISRCSRTAGTSSRRGCARCPAGKNPAARSHCSKPRGCSPCLPSGCLQPCAAARSG